MGALVSLLLSDRARRTSSDVLEARSPGAPAATGLTGRGAVPRRGLRGAVWLVVGGAASLLLLGLSALSTVIGPANGAAAVSRDATALVEAQCLGAGHEVYRSSIEGTDVRSTRAQGTAAVDLEAMFAVDGTGMRYLNATDGFDNRSFAIVRDEAHALRVDGVLVDPAATAPIVLQDFPTAFAYLVGAQVVLQCDPDAIVVEAHSAQHGNHTHLVLRQPGHDPVSGAGPAAQG